nr:MFS transporter [Nocardioides convexus]
MYLHEVRGFDLGLSGTLMALIAITGLLVTGPGGVLTDRYGARTILLTGISAMVVGNVVLAFATTPLVAALGLVLIGFNFGVSWPAFNALIAAVVSGDLRQQYFGINFALVNLGIGVGGIVGGLFADVGRPSTFTGIFLADALTGLVPMALLLGPLRHVHGRAAAPEEGADSEVELPGDPAPARGALADGAHLRRDVPRLRPAWRQASPASRGRPARSPPARSGWPSRSTPP